MNSRQVAFQAKTEVIHRSFLRSTVQRCTTLMDVVSVCTASTILLLGLLFITVVNIRKIHKETYGRAEMLTFMLLILKKYYQ